jgi:putative sterol carrier protein
MSVQLQANKPITKVSATELFSEALPKILVAYKDKGMKVTGTFEVNIFGQGGGHWFIDAAQCIVRPAANDDKTDCVLEMGVEDFSKITTGTLDAASAMRDGRVRFQGNIDNLMQLGHLLAG